MFSWLILVCHVLSETELSVGLITSPYTSTTFTDNLHMNLQGIEIHLKYLLQLQFDLRVYWEYMDLETETNESKWQIPSTFTDKGITMIIDAANDSIYSQFLAYEAIERDFLHMVISRSIDQLNGQTSSSSTLFLQTTFTSQALAFIDIIDEYDWQNLGLVYDQTINNVKLAEAFKENYNSETKFILDELVVDIQDKSTSERLTHRLESTTRDSGARVMLIFTDAVMAAQLLHSADESVMGGSGYAWILNSDAMKNLGEIAENSHADLEEENFGVLKTGAVGFLEQDGEYLMEYPLGTVQAILTLIVQGYLNQGFPKTKLQDIPGSAVRSYIMTNPPTPTLKYRLHFDSEGIKNTYYDIYNMQDFVKYQVGEWNSETRIIDLAQQDMIWPGFNTNSPDDKIPIIKLALLYPMHDEQGIDNDWGVYVKRGFDLALEVINNDQYVLGDYYIEPEYKDTYTSQSLARVILKSLAKVNILGYVGPFDSDVSAAYLEIIESDQDSKPMVSYGATSYALNSSQTYTKFLRSIQPDGLQAVAVAMFIQLQGWRNIGVIYTQDEMGVGIYDSFMGNVGTLEIEILNDEDKRGIVPDTDGVITQACKDSVQEVVSELVRKQVKIIVYLGNDVVAAQIAKVGHTKQLYGSRYAWIGSMWMTEELQQRIDRDYRDDKDGIYNVLNGAVGLGYRRALDQPGAVFQEAYNNRYTDDYSTLGMYAYDSAYLYATTIDGMIQRGEDFNDGQELIDALRAADITGASGKMKFTEGTNDRSAFGYTVVNMQNRELITVKQYDPLDPTMFQDQEGVELEWSGSGRPGDQWGSDFPCPFAEHMVSISYQGLGIIISIGVFLFSITLLLSYFSYTKWRQVDIHWITEPVTRSWKDTLVQATILIEFFQFVAIAPTFSSLRIVVEAASNVFMLDIVKVAQESQDTYWTLLVVIISLCYLWFALVIMIMLDAEHCLKKVPLCQRLLQLVNAVYLPFIGNTMFLPFSALLLDGFVCDHRAQGSPYVWRDCYMNCWQGDHTKYIIAAAVAIMLYQPVAVFSRPLWQQARVGLNLMAKPFFLLFKTCVQILLIAVGKSLQGISPVSHGVVFSILCSIFAYLTYKIRPFNYERCNLWELASLIAVSYMSMLATISEAAESSHVGWFICLCIGWTIIGLGTVLIQKYRFKYRNLLKPPGGMKVPVKVHALDFKKVENNYPHELDNSELPIVEARAPSPAEGSDEESSMDVSNSYSHDNPATPSRFENQQRV